MSHVSFCPAQCPHLTTKGRSILYLINTVENIVSCLGWFYTLSVPISLTKTYAYSRQLEIDLPITLSMNTIGLGIMCGTHRILELMRRDIIHHYCLERID